MPRHGPFAGITVGWVCMGLSLSPACLTYCNRYLGSSHLHAVSLSELRVAVQCSAVQWDGMGWVGCRPAGQDNDRVPKVR